MESAARITGTGSAFPERRMTNDDIAQELTRFGLKTDNQWIIDRTGIMERRVSNIENPAETNSSLGARAAEIALERAGRKPEDIDQIIYATCSPDTLLPSTACWLQQKIGARRAWAMDINAACSGFIYGVVTAEQFIRSGHSKTVLVLGAEVLSHFINWQDRTICILFGDGAGAAVVERVGARARSITNIPRTAAVKKSASSRGSADRWRSPSRRRATRWSPSTRSSSAGAAAPARSSRRSTPWSAPRW